MHCSLQNQKHRGCFCDLSKNDRRWVTFISLKTITSDPPLRHELAPSPGDGLGSNGGTRPWRWPKVWIEKKNWNMNNLFGSEISRNFRKCWQQTLHIFILFSMFWKHPRNSDKNSSTLIIKMTNSAEKWICWKLHFWNNNKIGRILLKFWGLSENLRDLEGSFLL